MAIVSFFNGLWGAFWPALITLWTGSLAILPRLVGAALILLIGWFLASLLGGLIKKILNNIPWKDVLARLELHGVLKNRLGLSSDVGAFFGWIVKWVLIITSFVAAINVLQLSFVNEFLGRLIIFLPSAIIAAIIVFLSFFVGGFMSQIVERLINALKIKGGEIAGLSLRWIIVFFGIFAALSFLFPEVEILTSKFADFLLLAAALAVGIGISKQAGEWVKKL